MTTLSRQMVARTMALAFALGCLAALPVAGATAAAIGTDGMPNQASADRPSSDPRNGGAYAGWGDMAGGVSARPYVTSLTVINGGIAVPVVINGTAASAEGPLGTVSTVLSPLNLCRSGQTPSPGACYATPNRVGLTVGYNAADTLGYNFGNPSTPMTPNIDANSIVDMTVALNTLGKSLRWTWINGDLLYWQTTNLGQDDATVHVKFKPAAQPFVNQFPVGNGCTATPIFNCSVATADSDVLTASMVFSLDDTLDPALTGAAFATQNAIAGFMVPSGQGQAPALDIQMASTHTKADGSPQLGTLEAFIPSAALLNLYGILPTDAATTFSTTRLGDPGTNGAPQYAAWDAATNGSDGLFVTVKDVTFSVPKYHMASKLKSARTSAKVRGSKTTIKASVTGCGKARKCVATVYNLGHGSGKRYLAAKKTVLSRKTVATKALSLAAPAAKLKKGDSYLLVVRAAKGKRLLASTTGRVR